MCITVDVYISEEVAAIGVAAEINYARKLRSTATQSERREEQKYGQQMTQFSINIFVRIISLGKIV